MTKHSSSSKIWIWIILLSIAAILYYWYASSLVAEPVLSTPTTIPTSTVQGVSTEAPYFEVYFTDPNNPNDRTVEEALINKIDGAKQTIDMAVFEFDIEAVAQAIIRAEKRGVEIRVVYDDEYTDPDPQMDELKSATIPAVPDDRSGYMHDKFFIFDNTCVWTGSFNITNNASRKNNENAIYFCSPEASANYSSEFDEMYAGEFGKSSPSDTPYPSFVLNGHRVENCFAAEDGCMEKVVAAVSTAKSTIHFMAYSFTDDELGNTMIADADRGVIVEGIFESKGASTDSSECGTLLKKGYDIRLDGNPATFHHKVIIVDGEFVIFGSFNFTANADNNNDENLLIWYDPTLASAFEQEYQLMKQEAYSPTGTECKR